MPTVTVPLLSVGHRECNIQAIGPVRCKGLLVKAVLVHRAPLQKRVCSKCGENRPNSNRVPGGSGGQVHGSAFNSNMNQMQNLDPVVPLQATENRWDRKAIQADQDSPDLVECKVKGLLNKPTIEKFTSISDQIIAWANKSEREKDGRTLIQVIRLMFEKATDEATWSEMYARLCSLHARPHWQLVLLDEFTCLTMLKYWFHLMRLTTLLGGFKFT
jgi:hypothetical protein